MTTRTARTMTGGAVRRSILALAVAATMATAAAPTVTKADSQPNFTCTDGTHTDTGVTGYGRHYYQQQGYTCTRTKA